MKTTTDGDAIVAEIAIHAPAERVFAALTDPRQRVQWWGAAGKFQVNHMESDLRPGGAWLMQGLGGGDQPFTLRGEYVTVEPPRVLAFTWNTEWGEPPTLVRFDLDEHDGVTTVKLTHSGFAAGAARDRYQGWPWLLALLRSHLQQKNGGAA